MQVSKYSTANPNFPKSLLEISPRPKAVYVLGNLPTAPMVAIVGTRKPTDYGRQVTHQLATELARAGVVVVSGLALGIDAIAQRAVVEAGGQTVAVLGHGLHQIYPAAHRGLAKQILTSGGALVSEYPEGTQPAKFNFPARNRIISGLSLAVIITEADASSGSLITANFALQQGKTVMAVPGNITSPRSAGPNNLLKAGAMPVTSAVDVLTALDFESRALSKPNASAQSPQEAKVLELLGQGVTNNQGLIDATGLSAQEFAHVITLMEITGKVRNLGAGVWVGC